jgi:hypothetical protein
MGLFSEQGVTTTSIEIEKVGLSLQLVKAGQRGGEGGQVAPRGKRNLRSLKVVHLPQRDAITADEVQNVRAFGTESELQTAQALMNQRLEQMRLNNDVTMEWQMLGAIKGIVMDSDGTTPLYNLFTEFEVEQQSMSFALNVDATKVKVKCTELQRKIEAQLGGIPYRGIHVLCSEEFFDGLVGHPVVEKAYDRWMDGEFMRTQQRKENGGGAFLFGNVLWEEYRGKVGDTRFIEQDAAYAIPLGVPNLFKTYFGPADYFETVNTIGLPYYAKQMMAPNGKRIDIEAQSNPLHLCTRPTAITKLTRTG